MSIIKRCIEQGIKVTPTTCIECDEYLPDDERVKAGMKCTTCAYGSGINPETVNEDSI